MRITINEVSGGHNKLSKDDFIKNAQLAHQNPDGTPKYDYSKIIFNGDCVENIICPEHGPFKVKRTLHVRENRGKCPKENKRKETKHNDNELKDVASKVGSTAEFKIKYNSEYNATIKRGYDFYAKITKHFKGVKTIGEEIVNAILSELGMKKGVDYLYNKKVSECKNKEGCPLKPDFQLLNYIGGEFWVEYDGEQHFEPVNRFGGEEKFIRTIEHDIRKNNYCNVNGIKMIRISYKTKKYEEIKDEIIRGLAGNQTIYLSKNYPELGWNDPRLKYDPEMKYLYSNEKNN